MQRVDQNYRSRSLARSLGVVLTLVVTSVVALNPAWADDPKYQRTADVIYGRKHGTALTLDVLRPAKPNGAAVILCVSGGWFSSHELDAVTLPFSAVLLDRGYTVFEVVHGSQPKFTIPEVIDDMHRAVRYIRHHAVDYSIDPQRIGITGASAGGHLSLMQGVAGTTGDPQDKDPVNRESSRVQAVACYFPPTDFLNYGKPGENAIGRGILKDFRAAFDFHEFDKQSKHFVPITDEQKLLEIGRQISPVTHVSADDPPTWIIHGDADKLVPIQQAELIIEKLKSVGVPAELSVKQNAAHGWPNQAGDQTLVADWFDKYLAAANISGTWDVEIDLGGNSGTPVFTLKQEGEKLTGLYKGQFGEADVIGTVKGDEVEFSFEFDGNKVVYKGKFSKDSMTGEADYAGQATGTWTGKRKEE